MPNLEQTIKTELRLALKKRGYENRRQIVRPNGLLIDLYVYDQATFYHLRLRRLGEWPSESDVGEVLRAWPVESRPQSTPPQKRTTLENQRAGPAFNCVSLAWTVAKPEMGGAKGAAP